jgi:hypothetical protein
MFHVTISFLPPCSLESIAVTYPSPSNFSMLNVSVIALSGSKVFRHANVLAN